MRPTIRATALICAAISLAACQTTSDKTAENGVADTLTGETTATAFAAANSGLAAAPGQCAMPIAGGPPPKPARGGDIAKNAVAKNVGRNLITRIGGQLGGGLGAAVASGVATDTIRTEQDLKGQWMVTDGAPDCGCRLDISSATNLKLKTSNQGRLKPVGCTSVLAGAARWTLGHTFTGFDAPFQLLAADNRTVVATMKRDGINYFSGTLADGRPVTMWRRGG